jgi:hypothetical protein
MVAKFRAAQSISSPPMMTTAMLRVLKARAAVRIVR